MWEYCRLRRRPVQLLTRNIRSTCSRAECILSTFLIPLFRFRFLASCIYLIVPCFVYISVPQTLARGPKLARGPHSTGPRRHAFSTNFSVDDYKIACFIHRCYNNMIYYEASIYYSLKLLIHRNKPRTH